jgi:nucleoside-diphosphate-sugar epimerase
MSTLITGAFGRVGTALIDHLDDSEFRYFDRIDNPSYTTTVGDVVDYPAVVAAFEGVDDVVHLAAASEVDASWSAVLHSNIVGTYNCLDAARRHQVERFVLASSNHVVGMYEQEHAPELYEPGYDYTLDGATLPRPDSFYGTSKVFSEALARYYVENYDFPERVYVLRIGSVRWPEYDHPYADAEQGVEDGRWDRGSDAYHREVNRMKATWLSRRDAASLVGSCLADDTVTYDVFYGTSDNDRSWFDDDSTRSVLGFDPQDSGDAWEEPPSDGVLSVEGSSALSIQTKS